MNRAEYLKQLPKKFMAAGALLFNDAGELLVLYPSYKEMWEIPGGIVEENESPREAVEREVKEELGLILKVKELLVCDYWHTTDEKPDNLQFIFHGGVLSSDQINSIELDTRELGSFEFVNVSNSEVLNELSKRERLGSRLVLALQALESKESYYLENAQK